MLVAILGVLIALFIVLNIRLDNFTNELSQTFSLIFFAWFVGVFIWLATRALPGKGNLALEIFHTTTNAIKKFIRSLIPQSK